LVAPYKRSDPALLRRFESFFAQLILLPLLKADFLQATQLRARFGLRTPDALHLAYAPPSMRVALDQRRTAAFG